MSDLAVAVDALLQACEKELTASSIESVSRTPETVRSLLQAGEAVVAYEVFCDNLYEDDLRAPRPLLLRLAEVVEQAGVGPGRLAPLLD